MDEKHENGYLDEDEVPRKPEEEGGKEDATRLHTIFCADAKERSSRGEPILLTPTPCWCGVSRRAKGASMERKEQILAKLADLNDGTGTLITVIECALLDDPLVTADEVRAIWAAATEEWEQTRKEEGGR